MPPSLDQPAEYDEHPMYCQCGSCPYCVDLPASSQSPAWAWHCARGRPTRFQHVSDHAKREQASTQRPSL